ncbi:MAG TPA: hypothetical protein VMV34_08700 [Terriglobia bacterium]|nr:hypothetical protein [Terriglobia bacterium]
MNFISRSQLVLLVVVLGLSCGACSKTSAPPAAQQASPSVSKAETTSDIWKSETTGKQYRVRIEGDHFYADWVELPPAAAQRGAYIRTVCQRAGSKWVGTSSVFMPCTVGEGKSEHIADTCHLTLKLEIDSISKDRITGRAQSLRKFDCQSCKVIEAGWAGFEWVPER